MLAQLRTRFENSILGPAPSPTLDTLLSKCAEEGNVRILLAMKNAHPNAAGLVQGLIDAGHQVDLVVSVPSSQKSLQHVTGLEPVVAPYSRLSQLIWRKTPKRLQVLGAPRVTDIIRILRRTAPEVVAVKDLRTMIIMLIALARIRRVTAVFLWDKPRYAAKWRMRSALAPIFLPRRKIHMGFFGEVGRPVPLGGALGTSTLLPYPPPVVNAIAKRDVHRSRVRIVAIGSLDNRVKRMVWVSQAIQQKGLGKQVEITFVGLGDERSTAYGEIRAFEAAHGLPPARILLDVPHPELLRMLPNFDILAHPSLKEMFGAVISEAMAAGLAVLCSDRCGAKVCFENEKSGLLFASGSKEDFADKLYRLVTESALRESIGAAASLRAAEDLSPAAWAVAFERIVASGPESADGEYPQS